MKRFKKIHSALSLAALGLLFVFSTLMSQESAAENFEKAFYYEDVQGDLQKAIELYEQILKQFPENQGIGAKAQLRIGICYEKLGNVMAVKAYEAVLNRFPKQAEAVAEARGRLAALRAEQPSGLTISTLPRRETPEKTGYLDARCLSPDGTKMFGIGPDLAVGQNIAYYDYAAKRLIQITNHSWSEPGIGMWANNPVSSPDGKQVAYIQGIWRGSDAVDLCVADMSGKSRLLYHNENGGIVPGDWLPDGSAIVAIVKQKDESFALGLIPTKGGSIKTLHKLDGRPGRRMFPDVSPDGRFIVFVGNVNGTRKLHFMRSDGRSLEILADQPADDFNPHWSPDGKHVVFLSRRIGNMALWGVSVKEGKPEGRPFLIQGGMNGSSLLNWTSQGLVFSKGVAINDVYVMPVNPENGKPAGTPRQLSYRPMGRNAYPVWSPDGRYLAFVSYESTSGPGSVVVFPVDGGQTREYSLPNRVRGLAGLFDLRWLPDGSGIGFARPVDGDAGKQVLFQLNLKTGEWKERSLPSLKSWTRTEWKRDGSSFFYAKFGKGVIDPGIIEVNLASGEEKYIYRPEKGQGWQLISLKTSRKHNLLAFKEDGIRLIVLDVDTGEKRTVFSKPHICLAWSPDDKYVSTLWNTKLVIIPSMGGAPKEFDFDFLPNMRTGNSEVIRSFDWSPDGKTIAFFVRYGHGATYLMRNIIPENRR